MLDNEEDRTGFKTAQDLLFRLIEKNIKEAKTEDVREFWKSVAWETGLYPRFDYPNWDYKTITVWREYDIAHKEVIGFSVYDLELIKPYVGNDPGKYINHLYKEGFWMVYSYGIDFDENGIPDCTVMKFIHQGPIEALKSNN